MDSLKNANSEMLIHEFAKAQVFFLILEMVESRVKSRHSKFKITI